MFAAGEAFGLVFGSVGLLFAAFGIVMIVFMVRKASEHRRTLREGLVAEARCLETFVVHHRSAEGGGHSQRRLILGFRTSEGRDVRAEIASDVSYVVGDIVPVRYLPERPERAVPAETSPGLGVGSYLAGGVLVLFTCVGLFFAATGFGLSAFMDGPADDGGTTPDSGEYWTTEP
ncbi:DUF3592 domain-containing protein [Streptomyces sp. NPDC002889]|uniref:DUF3592 domain-containing protein n=1 Tax=Streptomyces sp. NPDC002889 TaxID=3364669 RepID=UPI0036AEB94E